MRSLNLSQGRAELIGRDDAVQPSDDAELHGEFVPVEVEEVLEAAEWAKLVGFPDCRGRVVDGRALTVRRAGPVVVPSSGEWTGGRAAMTDRVRRNEALHNGKRDETVV